MSLWPAVALTIVMGVAPMWFLKPMEPSVTRLVEQVRRNQGQTVKNIVDSRKSIVDAFTMGRMAAPLVSASQPFFIDTARSS